MESYWNKGAIKTEGRWFDNFVISTTPIGPVTTPPNPVLYKTRYHGPGELSDWEVEVASDVNGEDVVFKSSGLGTGELVTISESNGIFIGSLEGKQALLSGGTYFSRVRQKSSNGEWSDWSRWHQPFIIE